MNEPTNESLTEPTSEPPAAFTPEPGPETTSESADGITSDDRVVLAIDVEGTRIAAGLVESGGRISARTETVAGFRLDAEGLWRTLESMVDKLLADNGGPDLAGVGVGCGGPMTWPAAEVSPLNVPAWQSFPLRERLRERHPGLPVRVHNDAVCMAVGEHWRGAGRGADNLLGIVVSDGVGGGLVLGGHLIDGASGNAGHIGHVIVDADGPECACGGRGCLEAIARGPRLVAWAQEQGWRPYMSNVTETDLADDARRGHPVACAAIRRAGRALGIAIASATHLLDLEVVSVGGGLSQAGPLLFDPVDEAFRAHARMEYAREVRVVPAALGQSAGLIGAAAFVFAADRYWNAD
jgi:glucokinase